MSTIFKNFENKKLLITSKVFKIMKRDTKNSISFKTEWRTIEETLILYLYVKQANFIEIRI